MAPVHNAKRSISTFLGKILDCEQSSISKVHEKRLYYISKEVPAILGEKRRFPYYIIAVFYSQKIQMPRPIIDG